MAAPTAKVGEPATDRLGHAEPALGGGLLKPAGLDARPVVADGRGDHVGLLLEQDPGLRLGRAVTVHVFGGGGHRREQLQCQPRAGSHTGVPGAETVTRAEASGATSSRRSAMPAGGEARRRPGHQGAQRHLLLAGEPPELGRLAADLLAPALDQCEHLSTESWMLRASRSRSAWAASTAAALAQLLLGPGADVAEVPKAAAAMTMMTVPVTVVWVTTPRTARSQAPMNTAAAMPQRIPLTTATASTGQAIQVMVSVGRPRRQQLWPDQRAGGQHAGRGHHQVGESSGQARSREPARSRRRTSPLHSTIAPQTAQAASGCAVRRPTLWTVKHDRRTPAW